MHIKQYNSNVMSLIGVWFGWVFFNICWGKKDKNHNYGCKSLTAVHSPSDFHEAGKGNCRSRTIMTARESSSLCFLDSSFPLTKILQPASGTDVDTRATELLASSSSFVVVGLGNMMANILLLIFLVVKQSSSNRQRDHP